MCAGFWGRAENRFGHIRIGSFAIQLLPKLKIRMQSKGLEILAIIEAKLGIQVLRSADVQNLHVEGGVSDIQFEVLGETERDADDGTNFHPVSFWLAAVRRVDRDAAA